MFLLNKNLLLRILISLANIGLFSQVEIIIIQVGRLLTLTTKALPGGESENHDV